MCLNATLKGKPIHHLNNKYVINSILVLHLYVRGNVCPFASGKRSTWAGQSMKEKDEPLRGGSPELGIAKQVLKVIKYSQKVGVRDSKRTQQHVHKWSQFNSSLVSQISQSWPCFHIWPPFSSDSLDSKRSNVYRHKAGFRAATIPWVNWLQKK